MTTFRFPLDEDDEPAVEVSAPERPEPTLHRQVGNPPRRTLGPAFGDWRDSGGPEGQARRRRVCRTPVAQALARLPL